MVSQDWVNTDPREFPTKLNQTFDTAMPTPAENIPDGNASAIAVVNYVVCTLQVMIYLWVQHVQEYLMWDQKYQSWRLVFAMIPVV